MSANERPFPDFLWIAMFVSLGMFLITLGIALFDYGGCKVAVFPYVFGAAFVMALFLYLTARGQL